MTDPIVSHDSDNLKRCCHCHEWKPREEFGRATRLRDGLQGECKACNRAYRTANRERAAEYQREYRVANAERLAEYRREYAAMNAERAREYAREYRAANRERMAEYQREYRVVNSERLAEYRAANAERIAERERAYRAANHEHIAAIRKAYYEANRERDIEASKAWNAANKERYLANCKAWNAANKERREEKQKVHRKAWVKANPDKVKAKDIRRRARKHEAGGTCTASDLIAIRAAQTDKSGRLICWACGKPIKDAPHLDHWIPLAKGGANDAGNLHYMHAKCNQTKSAKHPTELGRLI